MPLKNDGETGDGDGEKKVERLERVVKAGRKWR
jgi:hypothetical protein